MVFSGEWLKSGPQNLYILAVQTFVYDGQPISEKLA